MNFESLFGFLRLSENSLPRNIGEQILKVQTSSDTNTINNTIMKIFNTIFFVLLMNVISLNLSAQCASGGDGTGSDGATPTGNGSRLLLLYPSTAERDAALAAISTITYNGVVYPIETNTGVQDRRIRTSQDPAVAGTFPNPFTGTITLNLAAGGTVDCSYTANALPVEYTEINVKAMKEGNLLSWITAQEVNNHSFEIEASTDGVRFSTIETVLGAGNSDVENRYSYLDRGPFNAEVKYYRIKQIDFDGQYDYSEILVAENKDANQSSPQIKSNLITSGSTVEIFNVENTAYRLVSANGESISRGILTSADNIINTSELRKGMYFVVMDSGEVFKIVIM